MDPPSSSPPPVELSTLAATKSPVENSGDPPLGPPNPPPEDPLGDGGGGAKNGLVLKMPPEEEEEEEEGGGGEKEAKAGSPEEEVALGVGAGPPQKFTGLGKEELLRAASSPPWRKARICLLLLFWLGWAGMLGAAAAIVARAPTCRPLPSRQWWQLGALYRAPPKEFGGDLKGVSAHLDHVAGLGARGLILGPLHPQNASSLEGSKLPPLDQLEPSLGSLEDFGELLQAAKKKGLQLLVDLTPNFREEQVWGPLAKHPQFNEHMKGVLSSWLQRGVGGFLLDGVEELPLHFFSEWHNLTQAQPGPEGGSRVLVGGSRLQTPSKLLELLQSLAETSPGAPLLGRFLEALNGTSGPQHLPELLRFLEPGVPLIWSAGSPWQHLAGLHSVMAPQMLLLLWTLPGTPALSYGDELELWDVPGSPQQGQLTPMPWELLQEGRNHSQLLELCRQLGALRSRERSLSLGEAEVVNAGPEAAAFLRSWDQSQRFLVLLNPGPLPLTHISLQNSQVPPSLTLRLRTHQPLPADPQINLEELQLAPYEGVLLSFPYTP